MLNVMTSAVVENKYYYQDSITFQHECSEEIIMNEKSFIKTEEVHYKNEPSRTLCEFVYTRILVVPVHILHYNENSSS